MKEKIYHILKIVIIILSVFLFSQFPAFANSYLQRLSGHVDELRYQTVLMEENASLSGKTLDEFIGKFIRNIDEDFQRQGHTMNLLKERLKSLENARFNLEKASVLTRPFIFFLNVDPVIAKATFHQFSFSVPLTLEGFIWAVLGVLIGYFVFIFFCKCILWSQACWRSFSKRKLI